MAFTGNSLLVIVCLLFTGCSKKAWLDFLFFAKEDNQASRQASQKPCSDEIHARFQISLEKKLLDKILLDTNLKSRDKEIAVQNQQQKVNEAIAKHKDQLRKCKYLD